MKKNLVGIAIFLGTCLALMMCTILGSMGWGLFLSPSLQNFQMEAPPGIQSIDQWLKNSESKQGLRPGTEKSIQWFHGRPQKTALSIVYLHGFSASRSEISPVVETVSRDLGANAFFSRLSEHGKDGDSFQFITADLLWKDALEALMIGQQLGDQVILVGTSTGATLAYLLADWANRNGSPIEKMILLSPNFGLADPSSLLLVGPLGPLIARMVVGLHYSWTPINDRQSSIWNLKYRSEGLAGMMNLVAQAWQIPLGRVQTPVLALMTKSDTIIDLELAEKRIQSIPDHELNWITANGHVLTGEVTSPETVDQCIQLIKTFLKK